jgi:pyruvate dehydrogenase kinase 2/3/4
MRATVELHEDKKEGYPAVKTLVTLGKEDLSIKVIFCLHFDFIS